MDNLDDKPFVELVAIAKNVQLLDGWKQVDDFVVLEVGNRSIEVRHSFAETFVRGLLRGYERAVEME